MLDVVVLDGRGGLHAEKSRDLVGLAHDLGMASLDGRTGHRISPNHTPKGQISR